jgi:hypothetical protein
VTNGVFSTKRRAGNSKDVLLNFLSLQPVEGLGWPPASMMRDA